MFNFDNDYGHPRSGCLPVVILCITLVVMGCSAVNNAIEEEQALIKIKEYDAHYVPAQAGWCSGKPIPQEDRWILDCKYGFMSCE